MATQDFQNYTGKQGISATEFQQIVKGDIVNYLLPPSMLPTNPLREWRGRVERINQQGWVEVTVLDEGYDDQREIVRSSEIVAIVKSATNRALLD